MSRQRKATLSLILLSVVLATVAVANWFAGLNQDREIDRRIRKLEQDVKQLQQTIDRTEKAGKAKEKKE